VELGAGERGAIGGQQEVGALEIRRGGRDQVQLHRPLPQFGRGGCGRARGDRRRRAGDGEVHGAGAGAAAAVGVGVRRGGRGGLQQITQAVAVAAVGRAEVGHLRQVSLDGGLVELVGVTFGDRDGALGALAQAGAQAVAEVVRQQARLAADDLDGALGAGRHAVAAAVAEVLVDVHDLAHGHGVRPPVGVRESLWTNLSC